MRRQVFIHQPHDGYSWTSEAAARYHGVITKAAALYPDALPDNFARQPRRSGDGVIGDHATVPKAVGLIQVKEQAGGLSLQDQKIINALLFYSHDRMIDPNAVHEAPLQHLREYLGRHESNDQVRQCLTNLSEVILKFDYLDTDGDRKWGSGSLIVVSGHESGGEGVVKFTWPHWLRPLLAEPAKWARISMPIVRAFTTKYGIRLYENLEMVANRQVKEWIIGVDELRVLLGTGDKLRNWRDFNRRALEPALAEVNGLADFSAVCSVHRQRGRKILALRFVVTKSAGRERRELAGRDRRRNQGGAIALRPETHEAARRLADGFDIYAIEADWRTWSEGKARPRNPDAAFLKFVQSWVRNRRQGQLLL